ncbi:MULTISPECIES: flagellar motor protein MotB [unclassified Pseudomonas]|uniref:flagellar motor protein MotB n=1 Tax=unclassified Pseudomonas TaxID=196821 RepID=UPI00235E7C54|nr:MULTISPECIES: flagellar motor protein MotB [unclassified Pseudomonas]MDR6180163.1 chemotaxis protein MotB [Pseudomonas sp. SORGH_AS_0211]
MDNNQPIIVKRIKKSAAGHHGGAWKIAFADFATAMMAFFLVLWLMSSATPEQKKAIAGYFQDPIGFTESASPYVIDLGGTPTPAPDRTLNPEIQAQPDSTQNKVNPDVQERADPNDSNRVAPDPTQAPDQSDKRQPNDAAQQQKDASQAKMDPSQAEKIAEQVDKERLELLLQELQNKIEQNPELQKFKDQILLEITQDGLRIQIVDAENRPMFDSGSPRLKSYFEDILLAMADTIRQVPNKISISGHTDAARYAGKGDFSNWELSAGRANAARRALIAGGYPEEQVARIVGYASSAPFDREHPLNPVNRRIDIIVLTKKAQQAIEGRAGGNQAPKPAAGATPAASRSGVSSGGVSATGNLAQPINNAAFKNQVNAFDAGVIQGKP